MSRFKLRSWLAIVVFALTLVLPRTLSAHELLPGYLDLHETAAGQYSVLWKLPLQQGKRLPITPRFPEDCQLQGDLDSKLEASAWIYHGSLSCESSLKGKPIVIDGLAAVGTDVLVRFQPADAVRPETHLLKPLKQTTILGADVDSEPSGLVAYLRLGIEHILLGVDHLLLLLGLVLIARDGWMLLKTVTAFTLANSITLSVSAIGIVQVPTAPLNAAIALSILFIGTEVVRFMRGQTSFTLRHPWVLACGFGLLHGFGYARGLAELGLPHHELLLALLLFNVGIEIGQDLFVVLVLALERAFRQLQIRWPLWVRRMPAWTIGCAGAYWTIQTTVSLIKGGV